MLFRFVVREIKPYPSLSKMSPGLSARHSAPVVIIVTSRSDCDCNKQLSGVNDCLKKKKKKGVHSYSVKSQLVREIHNN